jgi:hypothetical protein
MAAGLGFKTFTTGEVLTAADVNGYLMQGVLVFASEAARDAAITSPQEGQFAYTKDNNSLWYYTGSAWAASGATGDIEGVTAGVGISGGGTSGTVTITNSMATAIDAKGDLVAGTGADTFSRLAVGSNDQVLTADSTAATGLKWAAASGGGMTSIASGSMSGASVNITSIPSGYQNLLLFCRNLSQSSSAQMTMGINSAGGSPYGGGTLAAAYTERTSAGIILINGQVSFSSGGFLQVNFLDYLNNHNGFANFSTTSAASGQRAFQYFTDTNQNAITSIQLGASGGSWTGGTYVLYGVK